jgi:hypothetical protein
MPLVNSCQYIIIDLSSMSYLRMDPRREKQTKHRQDVVGSSKHGRTGKGKALAGRYPPARHHPSHSSSEEEAKCEMFERHSPTETTSHLAHRLMMIPLPLFLPPKGRPWRRMTTTMLTFPMQLCKRMELSMLHFTGSILQVSYLYFSKGGSISIISKTNTGSNSNEYY